MKAESEQQRTNRDIARMAREVLYALLIAVVIRSLAFQPFDIPSGSMEPTLLIGDFLFVSKYSYGYSHYSFPFSPRLFSGRLFASPPQRGDVAVFRPPTQESVDYIKRIIGLPGDRIQVTDGVLSINGMPVERQRIADFVGEDPCGRSDRIVSVAQWHETLPNGVSYNTLQCTTFPGFPDTTGVYTVPPGHYFMMGDNRENSEDSRFSDVGYVPFENLIGPAQVIFFSVKQSDPVWAVWRWPWSVRWDRLFSLVH